MKKPIAIFARNMSRPSILPSSLPFFLPPSLPYLLTYLCPISSKALFFIATLVLSQSDTSFDQDVKVLPIITEGTCICFKGGFDLNQIAFKS